MSCDFKLTNYMVYIFITLSKELSKCVSIFSHVMMIDVSVSVTRHQVTVTSVSVMSVTVSRSSLKADRRL